MSVYSSEYAYSYEKISGTLVLFSYIIGIEFSLSHIKIYCNKEVKHYIWTYIQLYLSSEHISRYFPYEEK